MPRPGVSRQFLARRRSFLQGIAGGVVAVFATPSSAGPRPLLVFAAASLKNALDAIAERWQAENGRRATIAYAASSTLAKQIENGAPADLFISADLLWMDYLQQRGLIDPKTRFDLVGNELVLIAPKNSPAQGAIAPGLPLAAMLGGGRLALAD